MARRDRGEKSSKLIEEIFNAANSSLKMSGTPQVTVDNLVNFLEGTFDVKVKSGQKRAVTILSDCVLKIVSNGEGLDDNINEILTSEHLLELNKKGKISDDDLDHFAIAELVHDDPYIIKAKKYTPLEDCEAFREWDKEHKNDVRYKDDTRNRRIGYWILSNKKYNSQSEKILSIFAKYFVSSDNLIWKMVENVHMDEELDKLVMIDMGSILPRYKGTDVDCTCGAGKSLLVVKSDYRDNDKIDNIMTMKTGLYGCKNENCPDYYMNLKLTKSNNNIVDSVVFDDYQVMVKMNENFQSSRALLANIFIPTNEIEDFDDFKDALLEDTGEKFSSDEIRVIWRNSFPFIILDKVEEAVYEITENSEESEFDDLDDFIDMVYDEINKTRSSRNEIEDSELVDMYAAILYINHIIDDESENLNSSANAILMAEDKSEFISLCEAVGIDDEDDLDELWDILKTFVNSGKSRR